MIPQELLHANDMLNSVDGYSQSTPQLQGVNEHWLAFPKMVGIQSTPLNINTLKVNTPLYLNTSLGYKIQEKG